MLLYEFFYELRYRMGLLSDEPARKHVAKLFAYARHHLVVIHPFTNRKGHTTWLFTNLLAYSYGYQEMILYQQDKGEGKTQYLQAIRQADAYTLEPLQALISVQLQSL